MRNVNEFPLEATQYVQFNIYWCEWESARTGMPLHTNSMYYTLCVCVCVCKTPKRKSVISITFGPLSSPISFLQFVYIMLTQTIPIGKLIWLIYIPYISNNAVYGRMWQLQNELFVLRHLRPNKFQVNINFVKFSPFCLLLKMWWSSLWIFAFIVFGIALMCNVNLA